jgi:hypothetical protein
MEQVEIRVGDDLPQQPLVAPQHPAVGDAGDGVRHRHRDHGAGRRREQRRRGRAIAGAR